MRNKLNALTSAYVELKEFQEEIRLLRSLRYVTVAEKDLKAITKAYQQMKAEYDRMDKVVTAITNDIVGIVNSLSSLSVKNPYAVLSRAGRERLFYRLNQKRVKAEEKVVYELLCYEFAWDLPAKGTPRKSRGKQVKVSMNQLSLEETLKRLRSEVG